MRIVAVRAIVDATFFLPAAGALAVGAEKPVLLRFVVTLAANPIRLIKTDFGSRQCLQHVAIVSGVAIQAPELAVAVIERSRVRSH